MTQRKRSREAEAMEVFVGSGNVFADLDLPDAEELFAKSNLVIEIGRTIKARRLTQAKAAALMGIDQPKVSRLLRGDFKGFSTHRIMEFLTRLGRDVEIMIGPPMRSPRTGSIRVSTIPSRRGR